MDSIKNTLFVGKFVYHFDSLPSTNLFAQDLLSKSKPLEGTMISTAFQTAGRGQIGSKWESAAGQNVTLSLILYPLFLHPQKQFLLNQAIALAIRDTLQAYLSDQVFIKWPNDIYVNDLKICGVLIQNTLQTTTIQNSVIGIGININQQLFGESATKATSLALQTNKEYDLVPIVEALCQNIEFRYLELKSSAAENIANIYLEHLYRRHEWHLFRRTETGEQFSAKITNVSTNGLLEIEHINGVIEFFEIKQVAFLN